MALRRYWIPPQRSQISSNCRGRISAPRFLDRPVSSRLSSHISMSSFPATSKRDSGLASKNPNSDPLLEENKLLVIGPISEHDYNNEQRCLRKPWGSGEEMFFYVWSNLFSLLCFFHFVSHEDIFLSPDFSFFKLITKKCKKKSFLYLDFTHEKTFLQKTPPPVLLNINLLSWCFHFMFFFFLLISKTINKKWSYRTNSS